MREGPRPVELTGVTWGVRFDEHQLYVTVNHEGRRVLEVFVRGGVISAGVGLLASQMLRGGFAAQDVARSLRKVRGTHSLPFNGRWLACLNWWRRVGKGSQRAGSHNDFRVTPRGLARVLWNVGNF